MKHISILVADDHPILLKGLIQELEECNYNVLEGASNGAQALELIVTKKPNMAILDIEMPMLSGFEVIKKATDAGSLTKFIILTSHKEKAFVLRAKKLHISGYLLKDEPFSEIQNCLNTVAKNGTYFSKTFDHIFATKVSPELEKIKYLSPSERTIIRLISQEKNSKEIAAQLFISKRTVEKHRTNIIAKLDLSSEADALTTWTKENKELLLSL